LCKSFGAETNSGPQYLPALQSAIEKVLKKNKTPGVGIAIVSRTNVEWVAGIGKADVAADQPATADTLFRIGSVSKAFAAMAALQLQEEGKLKLTDTVKQWVPDVAFTNPWEATNPVRLVHLMEHTTGFDDIHLREYALNDPTPMALKDALAFGASSRVSRWAPGTRMSYCNSGPAVLAAVIEKVSGERFEDYVQEHFFTPLHMDTASYFYTPEVQQRLTKLYRNDGVTPYPYWHIALRPAGSINASARDMANYVRFYLQRGSLDGVQLIQPSSIERMETTETLPAAKLGNFAGYGLYNNALCDGPFTFHGHNGAVIGGLTEMAYLPEYGRGYVVMINSGNPKALTQITKLIRHYVIRDLTPPALPPVVSVPTELRQHYAGYYQGISPRVQGQYWLLRLFNIKILAVTSNGISTTVFGFSRHRWLPMSERLFRMEDQSAATFALLPDADRETLIQISFGTFKKVSAFQVWGQLAVIGVILAIFSISVIFALVRIARKVFGKPTSTAPWPVRVMRLVSAASLVIFLGLFFVGRNDLWSLGTCSWISIGILVASITFPISAAANLYLIYRARSAAMHRLVYWQSVLLAVALAAIAAYMLYWRAIPLCLWA
jgi:CubicO group peptidase (beta-lactamase class C family)